MGRWKLELRDELLGLEENENPTFLLFPIRHLFNKDNYELKSLKIVNYA